MKKLLLLLIVPCLTFSQDLYEDLLYYYSFSENDNNLAIDATGNYDNHFTATLYDVENTTDRFGNENSAKQFNGESSFINIPYHPSAMATLPLSISLWVKLDSVGHVGGLIRTEYRENYYSGCWINIQPSSISMAYGDCGPAQYYNRRSKLTNHFFLNEQWHHVVAVFTDELITDPNLDGYGSYEKRLYINGIETTGDYTGTGNNNICYYAYNNIGVPSPIIPCPGGYSCYDGVMGKADSNFSSSEDTIYHYKGKLDEVGYWTRELSADEVYDIYQNGLFDECLGLYNECGVCNGTELQANYNCDGECISDINNDNICDIVGCLDVNACNYNEYTEFEDIESCEYCFENDCLIYPSEFYDCNGICFTENDSNGNGVCDNDEVFGCMDGSTSNGLPIACNYNPNATQDDNSCEYSTCVGCIYYFACNYDPNASIYDESCIFYIDDCGVCGGSNSCYGCMDETACNYNIDALYEYNLDAEFGTEEYYNPCLYFDCFNDCGGNGVLTIFYEDEESGLGEEECVLAGCTNQSACNFNPEAEVGNSSCIYPEDFPNNLVDCDGECVSDINNDEICDIFGCIDSNACNYNVSANIDDGSCALFSYNCGCTQEGYCNYSIYAIYDDGSCYSTESDEGPVIECEGCTDANACNYNPAATINNSDCQYMTDMENYCDCYGSQLDALGECGGTCQSDIDDDNICDDVDDCVGELDICDVCNGPGAIYTCGCADIPVGDCNCWGWQIDVAGECGGTCQNDIDDDDICDDIDDCIGNYDLCGVCNGPGEIYECGCFNIPSGDCDCYNTAFDCAGVCGGSAIEDECGVCDGSGFYTCWDGTLACDELECPEIVGCTYESACNYMPDASFDDGFSCMFPGDVCEIDENNFGVYNVNCECVENNISTNELYDYKILIAIIDVLGREVNNIKSFQLHIYDDGSVEKKYIIK